ncbi:MAG: hypothetical protein AB7G23_07880 [Vicinamibacterales bacterium]
MNDDQLRALVREAIARRSGAHAAPDAPLATAAPSPRGAAMAPAAASATVTVSGHVSHATLTLVTGTDGDGECIVEPEVPCTHCGFCTAYGH